MTVYNQFSNEELLNKVNPKNKAIIKDYLMEIRLQKKKDTTIKVYKNNLDIISIIILEHFENKIITDMSRKDWRSMLLLLQDKGMSNARMNGILSSIRTLCDYLEEDQDFEYTSTASKIKSLSKEETRKTVFLTMEQIEKIAEVLESKEEWQKLLFLYLAVDSGARKTELYQMLKEPFYDDGNNVSNVVTGKRGKKFPLIYFSRTKYAAKKYFEWRGQDDFSSLWIKINKDGTKKDIAKNSLYSWTKQMNDIIEDIEGKKIGLTVHSFRHICAELFSDGTHYALKEIGRDRGLTLEEIQLHLNHTSSATTSGYLQDKSKEMKLEIFGFNNK